MSKIRSQNVFLVIMASFLLLEAASAAPTLILAPAYKALDLGQSLIITNSTSGYNYQTSFAWEIPPQKGFTQNGLNFTFTKTGYYPFQMEAWDSTNNQSNFTHATAEVQVNPKLNVSLVPYDTHVLLDMNATLTATAHGGTGPFTYRWYNGTDNCSVELNNTINASTYNTTPILKPSTFCVKIWDNRSENATAMTTLTPERTLQSPYGPVMANAS